MRPSGIVVDWVLGGIVPIGAVVASFAVDGASTRSWLRWSALGLYGASRVGMEVVGNLHIDEYDEYLEQRLGAHVAKISWEW